MADEAVKRLQDLKDRYDDAKNARKPFETEWYLNLAFFQGEHWLAWAKGRFSKPKLDRWRVLFTDNRVQPVIRTEVAKLTKARPTWSATPSGADEQSLIDAMLSERLVDSRWDLLDCQRKFVGALLWSRVCCNGFWKVGWDKTVGDGSEILTHAAGSDKVRAGEVNAGDAVINPQTQLAYRRGEIPDELVDGMPDVKFESIREGEATVEVKSPFQMYPDPLGGEEGIPSCRWIIERSIRSPEYVKERYGVDVKPDTPAMAGITEARMPGWRALQDDASGKKLGVEVFEMFERPGPEHKNGRHCVWTAKALLADEDNSTEDHGLPYVMWRGIPVPGRFWGTCTATTVRPLNAELNKTRSQMRENAAGMANPALLWPRDLQNQKYYGLPREKILFDPYAQHGPSYLVPPSLPGYIQAEPGLIENAIREGSGQHEVSNAQVPSGVTAAAAINLLQEADDTRLAPDVWDMERALSVAGQMLLKIMARYYTTERTVAIAGEDGGWDVDAFRNSMLSKVPDVKVPAGSMLPQSVAAKQAAMFQYLQLFGQYGIPMSAHDLGNFLRGVGVGGLERLVAGFTQDQAQIARENMLLSRGIPVEINEFDNDPAHLEGHAEVLKSRKFLLLPGDVKTGFLGHWEAHKQKMEAQMQPIPPDVGGGPPPVPPGVPGQGGQPLAPGMLAALGGAGNGNLLQPQ